MDAVTSSSGCTTTWACAARSVSRVSSRAAPVASLATAVVGQQRVSAAWREAQDEAAPRQSVPDVFGSAHRFDSSSVIPGGSVCARPSWARAVETMFSGVNPNLACSTFIGAEAPNVLMPMIAPVGPTQRSQPKVEPFSTETRAVSLGGKNLVAIRLRLLVEQLHRRHAHHPRPDAVGGQPLV